MGLFFETSVIFYYSWDQVAKAFWNRYPNPFSTHVLSEDTVCRELRGSQLYSRRLLTKTNRMPRLGERFGIPRILPVVEESYVNPGDKTITTYTRNIGFTRVMSVIEKVVYSPDPSNSGQTVVCRCAWIDSKVYGLRRAIERFGLERYRKNSKQAVNGFNYVVSKFYPVKVKPAAAVVTDTRQGGVGVVVGTMKEKATQRRVTSC